MALKAQGGGDATKAIVEGIDEYGKRVTREAMTIWNTASQDRIMEAAQGRSGIDSEGRQGREQNQLHELVQEFTPPVWDDSRDAWVFSVTHVAAKFHEWGAVPHEIRARHARAMVFEWPDMPPEVREKFEDQWESTTNMLEEPQVAFNTVDHPGVPAIGYLRHGREQARDRLEAGGFTVTDFGLEGGGA